MRRKTLTCAIVGISAVVLAAVALIVFVRMMRDGRPEVPLDWVKARCFEFDLYGSEDVPWTGQGAHMWYFEEQRFGIRLFRSAGKDDLLIFGPDGDGPLAYAYTSHRQLCSSPDDAVSVGCEWSMLKMAKEDDNPDLRWPVVK